MHREQQQHLWRIWHFTSPHWLKLQKMSWLAQLARMHLILLNAPILATSSFCSANRDFSALIDVATVVTTLMNSEHLRISKIWNSKYAPVGWRLDVIMTTIFIESFQWDGLCYFIGHQNLEITALLSASHWEHWWERGQKVHILFFAFALNTFNPPTTCPGPAFGVAIRADHSQQ